MSLPKCALTEWDVSLELVPPPGRNRFSKELGLRLLSELEQVSGVVSVGPGVLAIDVSVAAADYREAIARATHWVQTALSSVGVRPTPFTERVEAKTADRGERDLKIPNPELLGAAEVAELVGISKQRLAELRESARFPAPIAELHCGPVWASPAVQDFVRSWERRPGRPRNVGEKADSLAEVRRRHPRAYERWSRKGEAVLKQGFEAGAPSPS